MFLLPQNQKNLKKNGKKSNCDWKKSGGALSYIQGLKIERSILFISNQKGV